MMGRNAGHLALGAGHSANATMTLVAEEFGGEQVSLDRMARLVEGAILKSTAEGRPHGVVVLAEGLGACLDPADLAAFPDLPRDEHGHLRLAELPLGRLVRDRVEQGLKLHGIETTLVVKDVGYELRCVAPNAFDQEYTRELGAAAVATLLAGHANVMITRQNQRIVPIPFDQILDPKTGKTRVRMLDTSTESFASAMALQTRLAAADLEDARTLEKRTRYRDALLLSARQAGAVLAHARLVALRQALDEVVDLCRPAGLDHLGQRGVGLREREVVPQGAGKQPRFLRHDAEVHAQLVRAEMADVMAVDADAAAVRQVEALQQLRQRALAAARGPHQRRAGTGLEPQAEVLVYGGAVRRVAEAHAIDLDAARALASTPRRCGVRLCGRVHQVAEALYRDARLLELLPEAGQAQHGLHQPGGEHLECDQHADGELARLHHHQRAGAEQRERQALLDGGRGNAVVVGELAAVEARPQPRADVTAVALQQLRLHLQRLHRLHCGDVLGEERLVARAGVELRVEPAPQDRRHPGAQQREQRHRGQRDQRQRGAVVKHRREDQQHERRVQQHRGGGIGDEAADRLDALQARHQRAGRALLEVARRQAQQVLEDAHAEHRVDAVAGVQDKRLSSPRQRRAEGEEDRQRRRDHGERRMRVMHHHLVDHDLGAERRRKPDELQRERRQQHIAPDRSVAQQLGQEPAQAEALEARGLVGARRRFARTAAQHAGFEVTLERIARHRDRRALAGGDQHRIRARGQHQPETPGRGVRRAAPHRHRRQVSAPRSLDDGTSRKAEPERGRCAVQRRDVERGRKLLQEDPRLEGDAMGRAQRRHRPDQVRGLHWRLVQHWPLSRAGAAA